MSDRDGVPPWLDSIRTLASRASPGPWFVGTANDEACMTAVFVSTRDPREHAWVGVHDVIAITLLQSPWRAVSDQYDENAEFIAASITAVPRMCALIDELDAERARVAGFAAELVRSTHAFLAGTATEESLLHVLARVAAALRPENTEMG